MAHTVAFPDRLRTRLHPGNRGVVYRTPDVATLSCVRRDEATGRA
jgi:hypothetical protein